MRFTNSWSAFYENKEESLDQQRLLLSAIDKQEKDTWKLQSEIKKLKSSGSYMKVI